MESSKARQIYLVLRDRIAGGHYADKAALPVEQDLAAEHRVSRATVRRALAALEEEGLITRRQGSGTFVSLDGKPRPIAADFSDALAHLTAMGRTTSVQLLAFGYEEAPATAAEALGLPCGALVQRSVRVRALDGAPFSHLTTFVPEVIGRTYAEADLASKPLLSLLERSGHVLARATQSVGAQLATPDVAAALDIETGSALIALTRTVFDQDGRGIEHLAALYRPDRYVFRMELHRDRTSARWSPALRNEV
jgi:GntR family transcriptional regulator